MVNPALYKGMSFALKNSNKYKLIPTPDVRINPWVYH